jgi:hypothetical protein
MLMYRLLAHTSESRMGILEMPCRVILARSYDVADRRACISSAHFRSYVPTGGGRWIGEHTGCVGKCGGSSKALITEEEAI